MADIREDLRLTTIHGREFQKFSIDRRIYCVPVDDVGFLTLLSGCLRWSFHHPYGSAADTFQEEENRLGLQHDIMLRMMSGRLYYPPVENPRSVLECGYGFGDWALSLAEDFEDCLVSPSSCVSPGVWHHEGRCCSHNTRCCCATTYPSPSLGTN
jgi:hypothetical protein